MNPIRNIWRPPTLSELTPMMFNMGLTHLGSEASICLSRITEYGCLYLRYPDLKRLWEYFR